VQPQPKRGRIVPAVDGLERDTQGARFEAEARLQINLERVTSALCRAQCFGQTERQRDLAGGLARDAPGAVVGEAVGKGPAIGRIWRKLVFGAAPGVTAAGQKAWKRGQQRDSESCGPGT
jgi:hypothetical protein